MRRAVTAVLSAAAIALPAANAWGAATKNTAVVTRKFTGTAAQADRWGYVQVTITGPSLAIADAYATAAFAMGTAGPAWTARLRGYEAMTILAGEQVLTTAGFPAV